MAGNFEKLLETITILRAPGGCPWDQKQNLSDAARYLMDEAGELVDAALANDDDNAIEELGDLLFMTCFCCEILKDTLPITMDDIARVGNEKLIRRHPHVFSDGQAVHDTLESQQRWEAIKDQEKRDKGIDPDKASSLKVMPASCAPLHQAYGFQKNAADVGFDWPEIDGVWAKLDEELGEVKEAIASGDKGAIQHEIGDLLFSVVNLARWVNVQPDMALRQANTRFQQRFHLVEEEYDQTGKNMREAHIDELEAAWQRAKKTLSE